MTDQTLTKAGKPRKRKGRPNEGRPSKYKAEYCQMLFDHMADGGSFESFPAAIGRKYGYAAMPVKDSLYEWLTKHPEFSDARARGQAAARDFYEKIGHRGMRGALKTTIEDQVGVDVNGAPVKVKRRVRAVFSANAWNVVMRNRFGYKNEVKLDASVKASAVDGKTLAKIFTDPARAGAAQQIAEMIAAELEKKKTA